MLARSLENRCRVGSGWAHADRPVYRIRPGDRLEVEVVAPDGGRALVIRKLDAVPDGAGGLAPRIRVCDAQVRALPAAVVS
jgi:hypothetical protein